MIKPHILKNLKEINTLKLKREALEKEAGKLWKDSGRDWKTQNKISVLHGKMNSTQHRITYLFNLKGVNKVLWGAERLEVNKIIFEGVDRCWSYDKAVRGEEGCEWCEYKCEREDRINDRT